MSRAAVGRPCLSGGGSPDRDATGRCPRCRRTSAPTGPRRPPAIEVSDRATQTTDTGCPMCASAQPGGRASGPAGASCRRDRLAGRAALAEPGSARRAAFGQRGRQGRRAGPAGRRPDARLAAGDLPGGRPGRRAGAQPRRRGAAAVGTPSVAEAAALLEPRRRLLVAKRKSARGPGRDVHGGGGPTAGPRPAGRGRPRPGARDLITPRAVAELRRASVVVGLDQYVEQIRDLLRPGTRMQASGLGAEQERAPSAVGWPRQGRAVALIGAATRACTRWPARRWPRPATDIDVVVVPGVTAALAAASLLGAPLGHDHVSICLSDLHTPWEVIERRVRAAAEGDLVVTLLQPAQPGPGLAAGRRRWSCWRSTAPPAPLRSAGVTRCLPRRTRAHRHHPGRDRFGTVDMTTSWWSANRLAHGGRSDGHPARLPVAGPEEPDEPLNERARPRFTRSNAIPTGRLRSRVDTSGLPPLTRAVTERVVHSSADFGYLDDLVLPTSRCCAPAAAPSPRARRWSRTWDGRRGITGSR